MTSAPERKSKEPRRLNEGNRWVETHNFVHGKHRDSSNSCLVNDYLVGGFNPFEKYESNWIISPSRGENKKNWNHHLVIIPKPDFGGFEGRIPLRIHHPSDGVNLWKFTIGKKIIEIEMCIQICIRIHIHASYIRIVLTCCNHVVRVTVYDMYIYIYMSSL